MGHGHALDIGAGPLNDSLFLLRAGFSVDAVDRDPHTLALAATLNEPRLNVTHADMRDLPLAAGSYSLVVAIHVFPYLSRVDLSRIMPAIVDSLCQGGILCCTFFGYDDSWARQRRHMTFLGHSEIHALVSRMHPVVFSEHNYAGTDARQTPKRWHVFRCILRK